MATRGKEPFQKRQKEMARKDKQVRKAERRAQRKLDDADSDSDLAPAAESSELETGAPADSEEPSA